MAEFFQIGLTDKISEVNNRVDDAFIELSVLEDKTGGLDRKYAELKRELIKLQEEQISNLLGLRILTGLSAMMWVILLILHFIN